jgi:phage terminase small subunit
LTPEQSAAVSSVSQTITESGGSLSCKLHDKVKALELLARHLGMLNDRMDHSTLGKEITQNIYNIIDEKQKVKIENLHRTADDI